MNYVYLASNWIFGLLCLLLGFLALSDSIKAGFILLGMSFLLLPPIRNFVYSRTNFEIPFNYRAILIFVLFFSFSYFIGVSQENKKQLLADKQAEEQKEKLAKIKNENINFFRNNREKIISDVKTGISNKQYQLAITQATKYLEAQDEELNKLHSEAKLQYGEVQKNEQTKKILYEISVTSADDLEKNKNLYEQLASLQPNDESYRKKLSTYIK